jgi:uncharacterized protein (DUF427 family)
MTQSPLSITPFAGTVRIVFKGETIAETTNAMVLREGSRPANYYIPRTDVVMARLEPTSHQTYCPYKGDASYHSIVTPKGVARDAVWSYERPFDVAAGIAGLLSFYESEVDRIEVIPA